MDRESGREREGRGRRAPERDLALLVVRSRRRQPRKELRRGFGPRRTLVTGLLVVLAAGACAALLAAAAAPSLIESTCSLKNLKPLSLGSNSFVASANGSLLGVIPAKKNRQRLALREMSPWPPKATVAIEDRRFWQHGALDSVGIVRAAVADLKAGRSVQGGSTLTQQLARNLYIGKPKNTLSRKLHEACLAMKIGDRRSKKRILAAYLNVVCYGNQAYGVEAASQTYFSKPASKLSVWQAALLAGLPQAPSVYDPLRNPHAARARRDDVLLAMRNAGYLKPAAWDWARQQPLRLHPGSLYKTIREPYFFSYVTDQLVSQFGPQIVESGGLRVKTTIDPRLQSLARQAIRGLLKQKSDPSAALVAIDPRNGKVRAISVVVPSGERLQFNLAVQGHRQAGYMNLIDATANSVNTIFAQLVTQVGPPAVVRMAHRLGIRSNLLPVCSITLGTQAVSPLEMTSAYATLAARGIRRDPQAVESVRTADGRTLTFKQAKPARALAQDVADRLTYALEAVTQRGTATGANFGRPIAGKTGTAEKFVDAWLCGFTPQLGRS